MKSGGGFFVISLDFELHWGMFDKVSIDNYGEHYMGVKKVLPEILASFAEREIHATWATVGMLMARNKAELFDMLPKDSLRPQYPDMKMSAYRYLESTHIGESEKTDPNHFASSLVNEIVRTPNQELASHTFSHYYCQAGSDNRPEVFAADLERMKFVSSLYGQTPTSIVFPRNQATPGALKACYDHGLTAYRGNEDHFLYRGGTEQPLWKRGLRLIDAYVNLSGHHTFPLYAVRQSKPHNIPASRFLRPYSRRLRWLESRHIERIKSSMTQAARHNNIFHLWWHPHNFGVNSKANMKNLHELLNHFASLKETYGMESRNMREVAELAASNSGANRLLQP